MVRGNAPVSTASEIKQLREAIVDYIEALQEGGIDVSSMSLVDLVATTITATASQHLTIQGVTGKDLYLKLTDAAGARKVKVLDSADQAVATIDSDGNIVAVGVTAPVTGNVTGNLTGNVTGNVTGDVTGNSAGSHTGDVVNNNVAAHSYESGHADWTLSASEKKALILSVTAADQAANIIAPAENRMYIVKNGSGAAITIKKSAGTGITIADGKSAIVYYNGTDYARATADATH